MYESQYCIFLTEKNTLETSLPIIWHLNFSLKIHTKHEHLPSLKPAKVYFQV
jgi:hypothetical protein